MPRPDPTNELSHRPWPLPAGPWIMSQLWCDLLFAHWRVPIATLRPLIPERLEIDTFDGEAWVGVVPFRMEAVRPRGFPAVPWLSTFPELNLRTYVTVDDRPGVFFFSLDATNPIAVSVARRFFLLPYLRARMTCEPRGDELVYRSIRTHAGAPGARFEATYGPAGEVFRSTRDSLDHFLTERYCLYAQGSSVGRDSDALYRGEVHHAPWPLQPATATLTVNTLLESAGLGSGSTLPPPVDLIRPPRADGRYARVGSEGEPHLLFSRRLDVRVWPLRQV